MKKAVLTVIGNDRIGIIARVSNCLADANINILDISQTIMQDLFTMIMLVDMAECSKQFDAVRAELDRMAEEIRNMALVVGDAEFINTTNTPDCAANSILIIEKLVQSAKNGGEKVYL